MTMTTMRAPLQQRSRQTREALLDAAEVLGRTRTFDQLTVQETAALAGFTIGAFYARFPAKSSLLEALMERYESMIDGARRALDSSEADPRIVRRLADAFVEAYRANTGRLHLIESAIHADPEHAKRVAAIRSTILEFTIEILGRTYPIPRKELETAALLLVVPLRELHYKREFWPARGSSNAALTSRVVDAVTSFLGDRRPKRRTTKERQVSRIRRRDS